MRFSLDKVYKDVKIIITLPVALAQHLGDQQQFCAVTFKFILKLIWP